MAETLSYGFVKPQSGDRGSVFWTALETDVQQLNDHNHNGTNSAKLSSASTEAIIQHLSALSWVDTMDGAGTYSITVTIPSVLTSAEGTFDTVNISFRTLAGAILYLDADKQSDTTFNVYSNDNTLDVDVVYTT